MPVDAILGLMPGYRDRPAFQKGLLRMVAPFLAREHKPLHNYTWPPLSVSSGAVTIPVIVVGGIRNLRDITEIIARKDIDCVSLSRPFIIEPVSSSGSGRGSRTARGASTAATA
jgi:2,4-dienoyl-CoA reductase-like NADH-dependent reductase (Old Yellow Enzyme family)